MNLQRSDQATVVNPQVQVMPFWNHKASDEHICLKEPTVKKINIVKWMNSQMNALMKPTLLSFPL